MFWAPHKQCELAILILINTSVPIKFSTVKVDNWLNLNKRPCWDSIYDPRVRSVTLSCPRQTHEPRDYATSWQWSTKNWFCINSIQEQPLQVRLFWDAINCLQCLCSLKLKGGKGYHWHTLVFSSPCSMHSWFYFLLPTPVKWRWKNHSNIR